MSETHNYCDAPNGPCLDRFAFEARYQIAFKALLEIYFVSKNKLGDEPESVLNAVGILSKRALDQISKREV